MTVRAPRPRPTRPRGWWLDAAALAGFAAVTAWLALAPDAGLAAWDLAIRNAADAHRPPAADLAAAWVNRLGSGGILTVAAAGLAVALGLRRRSLWPLAPVLAAFTLTAAVVWPVKLLADRAAPHSPLPDAIEVRLFSQVDGLSYPSGHAVNAIVWYGVIGLLLAPWLGASVRRWVRWLPPLAVTLAGAYLGYHWLTDMLAGLCLGLIIDRALARVRWPAVDRAPARSALPPLSSRQPLSPLQDPLDHEVEAPKPRRS